MNRKLNPVVLVGALLALAGVAVLAVLATRGGGSSDEGKKVRALVTTTDGRALERTVIDPHGTPADPCTAEEIEAKFTRLASQVKKPDTVERIRSAARQLVAATGLDVFSQALRAP